MPTTTGDQNLRGQISATGCAQWDLWDVGLQEEQGGGGGTGRVWLGLVFAKPSADPAVLSLWCSWRQSHALGERPRAPTSPLLTLSLS